MIDYADPKCHPPPRPPALRVLIGTIITAGWLFAAIVVLAGIIVFSGWFFGPLLGWMMALALLATLVIAGSCVRAYRRRVTGLLLSYLHQPVRLNLPLAPMIAAAEAAETEGVARRLARLRAAIQDGARIGDALALANPAAEMRAVNLLNAADHSGRVGEVLDRLFRDELAAQDRAGAMVPVVYAALLVLAVAAILSLILIFVMPKFEQIFLDFGLRLPETTIAVVRAARTLYLPVTVGAGIVLLLMTAAVLRGLLRVRPARYPLVELGQRAAWVTPVLHAMARDRGMADVCHVIADAMAAGRPAPEALAEAQLPHLNVVLRERVREWADRVEKGGGLVDSARAAWMPRLLCGLLSTAPGGEMVGVFRFLARYYDGRFSRLATLLSAAATPAVSLVMGLIVGLVVFSLFMPMMRLIDHVQPTLGVPW